MRDGAVGWKKVVDHFMAQQRAHTSSCKMFESRELFCYLFFFDFVVNFLGQCTLKLITLSLRRLQRAGSIPMGSPRLADVISQVRLQYWMENSKYAWDSHGPTSMLGG